MLKPSLMPLPSRHLAAVASMALLFATTRAFGQDDALEQPYDSGEAQNPAPPIGVPAQREPSPPPAKAPAQVSGIVAPVQPPDTRPQGPVRARRRLALTGELGWNGIAGFGPVLSYHIIPQVTAELGAGLSLTGWKAGVRGRYNLLTSTVTPFLGVGVMGTSGFGQIKGDFDGQESSDPSATNAEEVTIRVRPSAFLQTVIGIDWTSRGGFTLIGALGWCTVLNHNLDIVAGKPTKEEREAFNVIFRSGGVISVATGYTFD